MAKKRAFRKVEISGELTIFSAAAVREQLLAALNSAAEIEVDLTQVSDFDSAGIQLMLAAKRQAAASGKSLVFAGHSAAVVDALDLCDLAGQLGDPVVLHSRS